MPLKLVTSSACLALLNPVFCAGYKGPVPQKEYSPENPPNILILTADDLGYNSVGAYGCGIANITPNIGAVLDALAESGLAENTIVIFLSDHGASFPFSKSQCYLNSSKTPLIVRWPGKVLPGTVDSTHFISGVDLMPTVMESAGLSLIPNLDGRSYLPILLNKEQADQMLFP